MDQQVDSAPHRRRRRDRRGAGGPSARTVLRLGAAGLLGLVLVGAPLACGAVHRPVMLPLLGVCIVLAAVTAALAAGNQADLAPVHALALPLLYLLMASAQIVPVPAGLRAWLDPAGSELLRLAGLAGSQPMSLDPPETYLRFAEAAAALSVGLAALVLSSGRRLRFVAPGLVAGGGLAALVIGLGHRAVAEDKIYGLLTSARGLPVGPFVNPNHTAELLELAAFAALAFAFSRRTLGGQRWWKILAAVLAAGALSCLSRGSLLALGAGVLTWFLLAPKSDEGEPFHRGKFAGLLVALLVIGGLAIVLGAEKLAKSVLATGGENLTKVSVWWDALKVVRAHPAGIGLGAFGRVYPVYQTIPSFSWFQFVENQPLSILIEAGIAGALLVLAALGMTLRRFARGARRDRVEASLAAGLVAVIAHNFSDFGLETLGVLLPFCALLGALFARQAVVAEPPVRRPRAAVLAAGAGAAVLVGIALLLSPSARNFDALLRSSPPEEAKQLARLASLAHPTDAVYALDVARADLQASSRLRQLNRAMILCPLCSGAHADAARTLWAIGRRPQAILEWKTVLAQAPTSLWEVLNELARDGATPHELQALANGRNRHEVSSFLLGRGMIAEAKDIIASAGEAATFDDKLVEISIAVRAGELAAAERLSKELLVTAPHHPRALLAAAEIAARAKKPDEAIAFVREGLRAEPMDVDLNRKLLALLMATDQWRAIDAALVGLRQALAASGIALTEANVAAAQVFERRGQVSRAVAEYQAALAIAPDDGNLLLALGRAAERAGSVATAVDAYTSLLRRSPGHPEASAALGRIQHDKKVLEAFRASPSHTGVEDK